MATARQHHSATLLPDGKVLVAGGHDGSGFISSAELYDPASGTWSSTGSMATARENHSATLLPGGKVLAAGGYSNGSYLSSAELYNARMQLFLPFITR
jgi:WD40 repeat protein